jgi:hypothetical protein
MIIVAIVFAGCGLFAFVSALWLGVSLLFGMPLPTDGQVSGLALLSPCVAAVAFAGMIAFDRR